MKKLCILAFSPAPWHSGRVYGSPRYHLWTLASLGHEVLYVEPPRQFRLQEKLTTETGRPFHVLSPALVPPYAPSRIPISTLSSAWRSATSTRIAAAAMAAVRSLGLKPDVYWFGAPWHRSILDQLPKGPKCVQFVYDNLSESPILSPRQSSQLDKWEKELAKGCGLILCNSQPLAAKRSTHPNVYTVDNAVPDEFLATDPEPPSSPAAGVMLAELQKLSRPRIVYGGVADLRLDPELFNAVSHSKECASLVFLGTKTESFPLSSSSRIHFLGTVNYNALPALYRHADVLLIAHKRMAFTETMYPAKLTEYLSSGKPIVSISLPEVVRIEKQARIRGTIRFADTPEQFTAAIARALSEDSPELAAERRRLAGERTWSLAGKKVEARLLELFGN